LATKYFLAIVENKATEETLTSNDDLVKKGNLAFKDTLASKEIQGSLNTIDLSSKG
jgi:hypothetical protein